MRRLLAIYGVVCALALGAWGHVLTSEVCAHAAGSPAVAANDDACCPAGREQHTAHSAVAHQTHGHAPASAKSCCHAASTAGAASAQSLKQFDAVCAHCMSRSAPVPLLTGMGGAHTTQRADIAPTVPVRQLTVAVLLRAAARAPAQHAPPAGARRHLLLSTFLI